MWVLHQLNQRTYSPQFADPAAPTPPGTPRRSGDTSVFPWQFPAKDLERFPALRKRNFFCMQRHQARALHYDLRLQLDGGTLSWAIPKGLIGMDKNGESSRMAVQTAIHPISYTTHEGSDGTGTPPDTALFHPCDNIQAEASVFRSGRRAGTLLWDIGEYEIGDSYFATDSDDEDARVTKRRKTSVEEQDDLGWHEEAKLRDRYYRPIRSPKQRTIRLTLKGGKKFVTLPAFSSDQWEQLTKPAFIFVLDVHNSRSSTFGRGGVQKKTWFVRLPRHVQRYEWDKGGEDGDFWGPSVKTGRTFAQVCSSSTKRPKMFESEMVRYEGWSEKTDEITEAEEKQYAVTEIVSAA